MQPVNVLVIDGQGGGLGRQLVAALSAQCPEAQLTAVGTNSLAANAMLKAGAMATAVCQSSATRVLIPVNHCENYIVGVPDQPISSLVAAAVQKVKALCNGEGC